MKRTLMTLVSVIGLSCCLLEHGKGSQESAQEQTRREEKRLEGRWTFLRCTINGEEFPLADDPTEIFFEAQEMKIVLMGKVTSQGKFSINPLAKPKAIDIANPAKEYQGKKGLGIYEFKSEELWLAIARAGEKRPGDFSCKKGSGHQLMVLRRSSEK